MGGLTPPAKANGIQQASQEAATEAAAGAKDVEASKSNQQQGTGKGTKRPAEEEASREAHTTALLQLAPNAKRQKTDAEWGRVARPDVCTESFTRRC